MTFPGLFREYIQCLPPVQSINELKKTTFINMCRQIYTYLAFKYILVYATNIEHREIKMWFPW